MKSRAVAAVGVIVCVIAVVGGIQFGRWSRNREVTRLTEERDGARESLARARRINAPLQADVAALRSRIGTGRALSGWDEIELTSRTPANGQPRTMWKASEVCMLELVGPDDDLSSATIMTGGASLQAVECAFRLLAGLAPDARPELQTLIRQSGDSGENVYLDTNGVRVTATMNRQLGMLFVKVGHIP